MNNKSFLFTAKCVRAKSEISGSILSVVIIFYFASILIFLSFFYVFFENKQNWQKLLLKSNKTIGFCGFQKKNIFVINALQS